MSKFNINTIKQLVLIAVLLMSSSAIAQKLPTVKLSFNHSWKFSKISNTTNSDEALSKTDFDDSKWLAVSLPHTANIEPLVVNDQWQGICWYRKEFEIASANKNKKVIIELEGAMNRAQVWINGQLAADHLGGYMPVVIDATNFVKVGQSNTIAVKLDNTDNPVSGPKPLKILDFNMYGGLYRDSWISYKDRIYISNPMLANKKAGGGIFVSFPKVATDESEVAIKTDIVNETSTSQDIECVQTIYFKGKKVAENKTISNGLAATKSVELNALIRIQNAKLWSPADPNLYQLETKVVVDGKLKDLEMTTFGIRSLEFKDNQLYVNGEKTFLRGVNRHQEYPFIGYALSDNAQYRDAKKIKEAGFNCIRLSHYPQSPAFLAACDELGIFVVDAILGWQYYADTDAFRNFCYNAATDLIRRDRNHPSVVSWEVSLNETKMPIFFMEELNKRVHEEYPGSQAFSSGWMPEVYDIYFQSRQHRILHGNENHADKPYFVSEYGDWEYYSSNGGLNQDKMPKGLRLEKSSRHLRAEGEKALVQQAYNLQESHNDNLATGVMGDGYWVMYDYNRGYHDEIEASGIMDIFRLPKFGYDFYASQKSPKEAIVLKIASYWNADSNLDVKVLSNCDQVELFLNGKSIASQKPDVDKNTTKISHAPFTFKIPSFQVGELKAVGYIDGKEVKQVSVKTPEAPHKLKIWFDESGKKPQSNVNDVIFVYIAAVDKNGTVVPTFDKKIDFVINGDAEVMNVGPITAEAGIATALVRIGSKSGKIAFEAAIANLKGNTVVKTVR
ncbi:beta-galactosidase [Flavobacterium sp. 28A]|uniref:glycoside hydrolase family 2 TIM barrel-domain containing protein n=1 Tax=Flavobacterium sp. 28A TaxID=2735895 RepID=UPI00156E3AE3|nr:glycoside hydrolase family 2 TIM barrel-domain containing protein [Flavobacterium sp. 28A]NRT14959.1 beta-galactosidase [Flavobacterium sp. 28A]